MMLAPNLVTIIWASPSDTYPDIGVLSGNRATQGDARAMEEDRLLVLRVREGAEDAFRTLMELHFPHAVRLANTFVNDQDAAEDIAQGIFMRLWSQRESWHPRVSARAYILGSVRNAALNLLKRRDVETRFAVLEIPDSVDHTQISQRIDRATQLRALDRALRDLSERRRVALTLRFEMDLSYAEVGAALGISANAANELVIRAVKSLRESLRDLI